MPEESLNELLSSLSLESFADAMADEGYDDLEMLKSMGPSLASVLCDDVGMDKTDAARLAEKVLASKVAAAPSAPPVDSRPAAEPAAVATPSATTEEVKDVSDDATEGTGKGNELSKMATFLTHAKLEHLWENLGEVTDEETDLILTSTKDENLKRLEALGVAKLKDRQALAQAVLKAKRAREASEKLASLATATSVVRFLSRNALHDLSEALKDMPDSEYDWFETTLKVADVSTSSGSDMFKEAVSKLQSPPYGLKSLLAMQFVNKMKKELGGGVAMA
jgi:hypothetical protein